MHLSLDGGAAAENIMTFDEAWPILKEEAINNLIANLEIDGLPNHKYFTSEEFIRFYTVVYSVSGPHEAQKLYDQYQRTFEDYISSKVLPSLRGKENESLLRALLRRWNNHKTMTRLLSRIFDYLSRYHIPEKQLPYLVETSHWTFNKIFGEIKDQVITAIISLVNMEREGEQIDCAMLKQVVEIFDEIREDALKRYSEENVIAATGHFHSKNGLDRIATKCYKDFNRKVKKCLEEGRAGTSSVGLMLTELDKAAEDIQGQIDDAKISLAIVKQVLEIFELGADALIDHAKDFEEALVEATALFYSTKALDWIDSKSYKDYMITVLECLEKEESRGSDYLRLTDKNKLSEVVHHELLNEKLYMPPSKKKRKLLQELNAQKYSCRLFGL